MNDRTFVRLRILSSTQIPEALTRLIGIECERSWHIGDKRGKSQIVEPQNGWLLSSGLSETASLEEHIASLFARVTSVADRIAKLADDSDSAVEVSCAIYAKHPPSLSFSSDVVQQLSKLKASFDIDLYVMDEPLASPTAHARG